MRWSRAAWFDSHNRRRDCLVPSGGCANMLIVSGMTAPTIPAPRSRNTDGALSHSPVITSSDSSLVESWNKRGKKEEHGKRCNFAAFAVHVPSKSPTLYPPTCPCCVPPQQHPNVQPRLVPESRLSVRRHLDGTTHEILGTVTRWQIRHACSPPGWC